MFVINGVTQKQIDGLAAELEKNQTEVSKNDKGAYEIEGKGIAAEAVYDAAAQTLTVTVKHKPFFIPEGTIEHGLAEAIAGIPAQ